MRADPGRYFEQWVGIELWKRLQYLGSGRLSHFRTKDGAEVDYILESAGSIAAIEVKWTSRPSLRHVPGLAAFLRDHPRVGRGVVVCRCPRPEQLSESIVALPWWLL